MTTHLQPVVQIAPTEPRSISVIGGDDMSIAVQAAGAQAAGGLTGFAAPSNAPSAGQVLSSLGGAGLQWVSTSGSLPLTTLGDILYENATPTPARLPGNTSTTRQFLRQQGNGTISAAPAWDVLQASDIPAIAESQVTGLTADLAAKAALAGATFTGATAVTPFVLTDAATITVDATRSNGFRVTLGGNRTLANPTGLVDGQMLLFEVTQDATGSRLLSYGTKYHFGTALPSPTLSTAAGALDLLGFRYNLARDQLLFIAFVAGF